MTFDDIVRIGKALHKHRALRVAAVVTAVLLVVLVVTFPQQPPSALEAVALFAIVAAMSMAASRLVSRCRRLPIRALRRDRSFQSL